MTNERRIVIFKAALEAVQASIDAHGYAVEPEIAWDFLTNMWFEAEDRDQDLALLRWQPGMPREFVEDYERLTIEAARAGRPTKPVGAGWRG